MNLIEIVNLVTLQGAQSGSVFNQKISGGLGFANNLSEDFLLALQGEL